MLSFHTIIVSNVRFYDHGFNGPMSDSEVATSKAEIHPTNSAIEVTWAFDVTTIKHKDDFTWLGICYCVGQRLSDDHANGR